ncbi:unannotated protein [freshwater metagenome]|uniref:Unannotated protein n=1 Tax=freshwater metagenome TaxID=449393 RepID=A0A6J7SKH6_9ZZZZ
MSSGAWRPTRALIRAIWLRVSSSKRMPRITESPVTHRPPASLATTSWLELCEACVSSALIAAIARSLLAIASILIIVVEVRTKISRTAINDFWRNCTRLVRYFIPLNQYSTRPLRIGSSTKRSEISANAKTINTRSVVSIQVEPSMSTAGRVT